MRHDHRHALEAVFVAGARVEQGERHDGRSCRAVAAANYRMVRQGKVLDVYGVVLSELMVQLWV